MEITNQQIIECSQALQTLNSPNLPWKTRLRLDRNLRKLNNAAADYEFSRSRLEWSVKKDQTKSSHKQDGTPDLTPEEHLLFQEKLQALFREKAEVEVHQVELYDSAEGQVPTEEASLDLANITLAPRQRATLLDVVFKEWMGKTAPKSSLNEQ